MNKFSLTLIVLAISIVTFSQIYLPPQDFSGTEFPPTGWTIENGGDDNTFEPGPMPVTSEPPCAWIETSANMEIDDRIISPEIILPAGSTPNIYAQLRGSVGYAIAQYWDPDNEVRYFIEVSTDGGSTWTAVLDLDDQASVLAAGASWPWDDWSWFNVAIDVSAYAGETIMVAFHHEKEFVPTGGGSYGITNFGVFEIVENDVELVSMQMPDYSLVNTEVGISGTFKNLGGNDINSFEGEYLINGTVSGTFEETGLTISQFESHYFTATNAEIFNSVEIFEVELIITKVNGVDDISPENNILMQDISIASEITDRKLLIEVFTSSTCGPCVGANENLIALLENNADSTYSLVKHQVNWPGNGDPYYIEDNGIRVDYYDVGGVPDLWVNGKMAETYLFNQGDFNAANNEEAYVEIDLQYTFDGLNVFASLEVDPKLNIEDASVYFTIVEKITYNNTGSNGETEFHNVVMAMIPDGYGTATSLSEGVTASFTGETNLITTFIEEFDDLMIVAYIQDNLTKSILQSESYDLDITSGIEKQNNESISIFPNPGNGLFTIQGVHHSRIEVCDISGKQILKRSGFEDIRTLDLSEFEKGIYFLKIINEKGEINIHKLLLN